MIEVKNITKRYGDHIAVKDLSFSIERGKIYGFLGPNGAGKSTTMNIITGTLAATSGTVLINGHDIYEEPIEAKSCIGYLPEIPPLYSDMTPLEFLSFVAEARGVDYDRITYRVREVMGLTQIDEVKNRLIKNLSKGYRQRVGIAQAMIGNPDIIILDEPTVGLDPLQIIEIRGLIKKLGQTKTVIVSSHILAEIAEICDHVMIISKGKLVADDTIDNLKAAVDRADTIHITLRGKTDRVVDIFNGINGILNFELDNSNENENTVCLTLTIEKGTDPRDDIFFKLAENKIPILALELEKVTLESVFLALTNEDEENALTAVPDIPNAENDDEENFKANQNNGDNDNDNKNDENDNDDYKPLFKKGE